MARGHYLIELSIDSRLATDALEMVSTQAIHLSAGAIVGKWTIEIDDVVWAQAKKYD